MVLSEGGRLEGSLEVVTFKGWGFSEGFGRLQGLEKTVCCERWPSWEGHLWGDSGDGEETPVCCGKPCLGG